MASEPEEEPVSVLQRFEKRLEGLVEGAFAKVFKGVVHPVEILNAMQREAEAHKAILAGGRTLVPNRYVIDLSPYDHSRVAPYAAALAQELAQSQAEFIGEQGWTVYGDVIVEIERGEGLDTGMFRVTAEVYTGGDVAPQPAYEAPSPYQQYDQPQYPGPGGPVPGGPGRTVRLVAGDGRSYPLSIGSTVIGRGDQANLRLPDVGIAPSTPGRGCWPSPTAWAAWPPVTSPATSSSRPWRRSTKTCPATPWSTPSGAPSTRRTSRSVTRLTPTQPWRAWVPR